MLEVAGRISVFGESADATRRISPQTPGLAAIVVARPEANERYRALKAYVHPCYGRGDLMLVDSDYERRTLREILDTAAWMLNARKVGMTVEKPVFDIGLPVDEADAQGVRTFCIPDFVVTATDRDLEAVMDLRPVERPA